jgi:hypothetical protein
LKKDSNVILKIGDTTEIIVSLNNWRL